MALVVHADPPAEHKAYLHRSGRTARAGAAGTVITMMTDQQVKDVRTLTRAAGINPTTTRVSGPGHAMLQELAPGERVLVAGGLPDDRPAQANQSRGGGGGGRAVRWSAPGRRPGRSRPLAGSVAIRRQSFRRPSRRLRLQRHSGGTHSAADFSRRRGR